MRGIVKSQFNLEVNTVFAHLKSPATDASLLSPSSGAAAADPASISDHDLRKLTWGVCTMSRRLRVTSTDKCLLPT